MLYRVNFRGGQDYIGALGPDGNRIEGCYLGFRRVAWGLGDHENCGCNVERML